MTPEIEARAAELFASWRETFTRWQGLGTKDSELVWTEAEERERQAHDVLMTYVLEHNLITWVQQQPGW